MLVPITLIDTTLGTPSYQTSGAVAFDFVCRTTTTIQPNSIALLPGNIVVQIPSGYMLMVAPRSSMPRKKLLVFPHSVGIIDQDYSGPADEILIQVQSISQEPVIVERGERIAQGIFVKIERAEWQLQDVNTNANRGGFGTTGSK